MEKTWDILSCSQLRKVSNRKNQCEDHISCLPDEVLYYIQSLLDYKKVAQMSILSHRWLNLWNHAPVLQFGAPVLLDLHLRAPVVPDGRNQKLECDQFVSTISRVSDGSWETPKRECELLRHWICDVRNQKLECDKSVFWMTCHTPDERNQKGECDKIVNWMSRVSQIHKGQNSDELRVSYTLYKCYKKKDIDSWWEDTVAGEFQSLELDFIKDAPSLALKYLKIEDCVNLEIMDISNCNIVSLIITAPPWLTLKQLPRLIELSIDGTPCECRRDSLCHPKLKTLTLSPFIPKAILEQFKLTSRLTELKRLVINTDASGDKSLTGLVDFINACPLLEEFVLKQTWIQPRRSSRTHKKAERCRLKCLKVVEFLGYYGRGSDAEFIVHLMENADNLEKVIIDPWNPERINHRYEEEAEARSLALQQLKEYVPPLVQFIIR